MAATYYVNLTNGSTTGLGTSASPLNYAQLVNYFDSSFGTAHGVTVDYDSTFYLSGNLDGLFPFVSGGYTYNLFLNYALPSAGTFKFIGMGPVVIFSIVGATHFITCKNSSTTAFSTTDLEFHNLALLINSNIIQSASVSYPFGGVGSCRNIKYKNCYIKPSISPNPIQMKGFTGVMDLFGCTLDGTVSIGGSVGDVGTAFKMYDCHLPGTIFIRGVAIIAEGNSCLSLPTIQGSTDTTQYIAPVVVTQSLSLPTLNSFLGSVDYFSKKDNTLYSNYSIKQNGATFRGASPTLRILYDFVYDTYGVARDGSGAFAFGESDVPTGFGNIGAFYFGPEYTNTTLDVLSLPTIQMMVVEYQMDINPPYELPTVRIEVVNGIVPQLYTRFSANFKATPITKGGMGSVIETVSGKSSYSIYSVYGSSPFTVEFTAFDYDNHVSVLNSDGSVVSASGYEWVVTAFNWKFGEVGEDWTVTTEPVIRHTYCGAHGEKYNVQVMLDYQLLEK